MIWSLIFINFLFFLILLPELKFSNILFFLHPSFFIIFKFFSSVKEFFLKIYMTKIEEKRVIHEIPILVDIVKSFLHSGMTFPEALIDAAKRRAWSPQISHSLKFICEHYNLGHGLSDCLYKVQRVFMESPQRKFLSFLFISMAVSYQSGAGAVFILERVKEKVNDQINLRRKLKLSTAQMRMQALVILVAPLLIAVIIAFITPNNLTFFIETVVGNFLLFFMILFYLLAVYFLKKLIKIN